MTLNQGGRMKKIFCSFLLVLLLCTLGFTSLCNQRKNIPFVTVAKDQYSGLVQPKDFVISTQASWCDFWNEFKGGFYPKPPCDTTLVNFNSEIVIISAIGEKSDGCYDVKIQSIWADENNNLSVLVFDIVPGNSCACTGALVQPVHAVKIKKPVGQVKFVHRKAYFQCEQ
jgi:hypothetical protein